ncbi:cytochrome P450 6j1-like [Coccinella septempunctata]|uniref:cytochrome P450 6j1-like n=1 Tax=Coccinella septempunctata TaxID=41139 RepID=UPI001D05DA94|nr:cytochrome P450 6j1-like [Coccinella septempunctata]
MIALYTGLLLVILSIIFYIYMTRNFKHWKKRKIPFLKPEPIFGNLRDVCLWKTTIGEFCRSVYETTKEPFIGFFILDEPCLMVNDLDLIRNILIKDFDHFLNRTMTNNEAHDAIGSNILFLMKTPRWRDIRRRMTPAFSSGKMKLMSKLMIKCAEDMVDYVRKKIKHENLEVRELCGKFTTDAITSTSFGLEAGCFEQEDAPFRVIARRIYNWQFVWHAIQTTCFFIAPKLVHLLRMSFIDGLSSNFFRDVFWRTMKDREKTKFVRNDLLDILIEMKKQDQIDNVESLDGDILVAQAVQFFIAGYETTSSTMTFLLMELAHNPDIQKKVRDEIIRVRNKYGGFCYDGLQEMEYLECTLYETLRKYPIVPFLDRRCSKRYQIPGSDLVLEKGDMIYIPIMGIHYDPEYFPDPQRFEPNRFRKENSETRHNMTFLSFGDGPRNCIGRRYSLLNAKCGLAHLLSNFEVQPCPDKNEKFEFNSKGFLLQPLNGITLLFKEIN